jgi:hypothetical protein
MINCRLSYLGVLVFCLNSSRLLTLLCRHDILLERRVQPHLTNRSMNSNALAVYGPNSQQEETTMASYVSGQEALDRARELSRAREDTEGLRLAQSRFLDELPGAVFAVITLVWVVLSFTHLIW